MTVLAVGVYSPVAPQQASRYVLQIVRENGDLRASTGGGRTIRRLVRREVRVENCAPKQPQQCRRRAQQALA
jgi:hypothetical protein